MRIKLKRKSQFPESSPVWTGAEVGRYKRHGILIRKLTKPRIRKDTHGYQDVVMPPTQGWYPSKTASFTFFHQSEEFDPEIILNLIKPEYNGAIWKNPWNNLYTLKVPKDKKKEVWSKLYSKQFWFNTKKYWWEPRYNHHAVKEVNHARWSKNARKRVGIAVSEESKN